MHDNPIQITEACMIFVDLINSSSFSSFIEPTEYAKWILSFQDSFEKLATKYFGSESFIRTAGDEGFVFIPKWVFDSKTAAYKAISFAFEFKTLIKFLPYKILNKTQDNLMPYGLRLAVGIHYGIVTYTYKPKEKGGKIISEIDKYIGYNINYAKRIETCSREGKYSNIFVSSVIYEILLAQKPIIFEKSRQELKGLEKAIEVYEVKSAFIDEEPIRELLNEEWIKFITDKNHLSNYNIINEYWFKSYHLSFLYQLFKQSKGISNKEFHEAEFKKELFRYLEIDDPIVEFIQAIEYDSNNDLTLAIEKLKKILVKYPEFIYAKILLIELLLKLLKKPNNKNSEIVFLSDLTKELLNYFPSHLTEKEKEKLIKIQKEAEKLRK